MGLPRMLVVTAALLALAAGGSQAHPTPAAATIQAYFLQGEQLVGLQRDGSTIRAAVTALLAGPTSAELGRKVRSYVPAGTPLRSVSVANGVATVDLGERFAAGRDAEELDARIAQLVYTVTSVPGVKSVRVLVAGGVPLGLFPGHALSKPVTRAGVARPAVPPPAPVPDPGGTPSDDIRALQQRLADLGFMAAEGVDGVQGEQTRFAVIAFQKWARLGRDGVVGPQTRAALDRAERPRPVTTGSGRRVEVLLDRQLALAVDGGAVIRTIHISSGAAGTATPPGSFSVFRKEERSWSVPFRVWLPWASYFVGGIAFHEYPDVPVQAASHGCVRTPRYDAKWLYEFTPNGTPVVVRATP